MIGTSGTAGAAPDAQSTVDAYFAANSSFWRDLYAGDDVYGRIHQLRHAVALSWLDELDLPMGSRVLDIGCGAGVTSLSLALRGMQVTATDTVPQMVELTRGRADDAGVGDRVSAGLGDAHALGFPDAAFDAVVALGVMPWLHSPAAAIREMARVLRPGGVVIASADNRARLNYRLDPKLNPALAPLRSAVKARVRRGAVERGESAPSTLHGVAEFDGLIRSAGLQRVRARTLGFGPFTLLGRRVLPERIGVALHERLQAAADRGATRLRPTGSQYLVMARKPPAPAG